MARSYRPRKRYALATRRQRAAQEADVGDELEERRMAKNECEARRREKLKKADGEPGIIDPMPKMAKGSVAIKEFLQITELKKSRGE